MTNKNKHINHTSKELSILVSLYGLSFMLKTGKGNEKKFFEYTFETTHPVRLADKLKKVFDERNLNEYHFDKIKLIHHNLLNTIVPLEFFNENQAADLLGTNIKMLKNDPVEYDILENYQSVNIYVPFSQPQQFLADKTSELSSLHSMSKYLLKIEKVRQKNLNLPVFEIYLNIFKKDFQIFVFKNNRLQLSNQFKYENTDEFLYYLFFVWETLAINNNNMHIYLSGIEKNNEIAANLSDFTQNYSLLSPVFSSSINNYILD